MFSQKETNYRRIPMIIAAVAAVCLTVFLCVLLALGGIAVSQTRESSGYAVIDHVVKQQIDDPTAPAGIVTEYRFAINETLSHDTCLAFYTVHQYVEVTADGESVHSIMPGDRQISKTVGSNWSFVPLYREDAGKEITVRITPVYKSFVDREVEFLLGSPLDIYTDRMMKDLPQVLLGMAAVFLGIALVLLSVFCRFSRWKAPGLGDLGVFSVMLGVWRLSDTRFTPLVFPGDSVLLFFLSVTMLMFGVIPLIRSIAVQINPISRRILHAFCALDALVAVVQLSLQLFGIAELREGMVIIHMMVIAGILVVLGNILFDRIKFPSADRSSFERRLPLILAVGVLVDLILFYAQASSSGLVFSLLALLIYILFVGVYSLFHAIDEANRNIRYKELAHTDMMTGLGSRYAYGSFCEQNRTDIPPTLTLVFMDTDGLKDVNDCIGHAAGDEIITGTAQCIREVFGNSSECFRMGGDEFLVIMDADKATVETKLVAFERAVDRWSGKYVNHLSVSYGAVSAADYPGISLDELLKRADALMYRNKQSARDAGQVAPATPEADPR